MQAYARPHMTVFMEGQPVVREYLTGDPTAYLLRPCNAGRGHDKRKARPFYDKDALNHCVRRACEKAKVERFTRHQIRHLVGTEREHRYGWDAARAALGHSSVSTTKIYVERDVELMRQIAMKVG